MLYQIAVPGPIEDVEELRVLEWHAGPDQPFAAGDLVVELETHKAVVEVRAGRAGILRAILAPPGDWQRLGQPLAIVSDSPDEPVPAAPGELAPMLVEFEVT